jgi:hypothetical protein
MPGCGSAFSEKVDFSLEGFRRYNFLLKNAFTGVFFRFAPFGWWFTPAVL